MSYQDELLDEVDAAKPLTNYSPRLGIGRHKVAIKRFRIKKSTKVGGKPIVELDVIVLESTVHPKGEVRGWPWFVALPDVAGEYQKARLQEFTNAVKKSIGDERVGKLVNADMLSESQKGRGLVLVCDVVQAYKNGVELTSKGEKVTNISWTPVTQTLEAVAATRAQIDKMDAQQAATTPQTAVQAVTSAPAAAPAATPAASATGALDSILG